MDEWMHEWMAGPDNICGPALFYHMDLKEHSDYFPSFPPAGRGCVSAAIPGARQDREESESLPVCPIQISPLHLVLTTSGPPSIREKLGVERNLWIKQFKSLF